MKYISQKQSGYSLLETVIYIAVFSLMSIIVVNSFLISLSSSRTAFGKRNLLEAGNSAMERMTREIRDADSVVDANSVFGSTPGELEINTASPLRTVKFQVSSGSLDMYEDSSLHGTISGTKTTVSNLVFRKIQTLYGVGVRIELTLTNEQGLSANFYNTAILRGSY